MKKIKKQSPAPGKHKSKFNEIQSAVNNTKDFPPFETDFIWAYPVNNIFRTFNGKLDLKSKLGK